MTPGEPHTSSPLLRDEGNPDWVESQRLRTLYPEHVWVVAEGEPRGVTVDDVRRAATRQDPVVDWEAELRDAPPSDLLKVIDALTQLRDDWRQIGRSYATRAGDPGISLYEKTVLIVRGSVHLSVVDGLDEQIAGAIDRGDLLGWDPADVGAGDSRSDGAEAETQTTRDD